MSLAAQQHDMRLAALVLLAVFAMACLVFLPRELAFIRGAGKRWLARFVVQDALVLLAVLAVLVPCGLAAKLTLPLLLTVVGGFTLLWVSVVWAALARYSYVRQLLTAAREEAVAKLRQQAGPPEEGADGE
jgi:hypothetical protein